MDDDVKKIASLFGRMGGEANIKKHGKERMKLISKLGVEARKKRLKKRNKLLTSKLERKG